MKNRDCNFVHDLEQQQKGSMNKCIKCGGDMIGDGYTTVRQCENAEDDGQPREPDADPVYCNYGEE